ncbi:MAG: hypothetical protein ACO3PB_08795, partial [Miltoncostaeaceae bacterium]
MNDRRASLADAVTPLRARAGAVTAFDTVLAACSALLVALTAVVMISSTWPSWAFTSSTVTCTRVRIGT